MKFLTTTALIAGMAATATFADEHKSDESGMSSDMSESHSMIRSRDITGGNIYTTADATDWVEDEMHDGVDEGWNSIGEIEDLVLDQSGQIIGLIGEIGGFLDIADKHVMIELSDLNLVAVDDRTYAYVTNKTEEELESMEAVDESFLN